MEIMDILLERNMRTESKDAAEFFKTLCVNREEVSWSRAVDQLPWTARPLFEKL